jgi:hypothetical protein
LVGFSDAVIAEPSLLTYAESSEYRGFACHNQNFVLESALYNRSPCCFDFALQSSKTTIRNEESSPFCSCLQFAEVFVDKKLMLRGEIFPI